MDAANNVTQVTDAAGNVITDTFNAMNRNTSRSVSLVTGFMDTTSETRTYDALGRMSSNADNDYKVLYTYGSRGLSSTVYQEKQEYVVGPAYQKVVTTKFDAAGNRTYQAYPSGLTLTYSYNDINAMSSVTDGTNSIASFSYIGYRPKVTTFGNSTTQTNTYGGFREDLTTIHHETSAPVTLVRMDYGYNKVHDRTYERFGSSGSAGDAFEYDKARRLTKAWMGSSTPASPSGNTYVQTIVYNMDDDGNRTSVVTTPYGVSPTTQSYTTNSLNQYTVVGGTGQTYDANGNLTDNGTYKFKYNYKNLMCEVRLSSNNNLVATYTYDAKGRRIGKAVSGGTTQRFIYSRVETVETFDGSNNWKQDCVFNVTGIDRILMLEQADVLDEDGDSNTTELTRSFYHRNALGSVMEVSTASQSEGASYRYSAEGAISIYKGGVQQANDPLGQSLGFTGRAHDRETGAMYFRARLLDPACGRFFQRDPLDYEDGGGLYEYVRGNPVNLRDPMGEGGQESRMDFDIDGAGGGGGATSDDSSDDDDAGGAAAAGAGALGAGAAADELRGAEHTTNQTESNRENHENKQGQKQAQQRRADGNPMNEGRGAGHGTTGVAERKAQQAAIDEANRLKNEASRAAHKAAQAARKGRRLCRVGGWLGCICRFVLF